VSIKGVWRLKRTAKNLWLRLQPRALILLYHRVAEVDCDPQLLCVSPRHFQEHLEVISHYYRPLSLQNLVQHLKKGQMTRRSIVITFDDGYADNLLSAKPLLDQYGTPATVFVTSGQVNSKSEFWWDELDRLLFQRGTLPQKLSLRVAGKHYEWDLGACAAYSDYIYRRHCHWNVLKKEDPTTLQIIYSELCNLLHSLQEPERQDVLDQIRNWAGMDSKGRESHRALTSDEAIKLASDGLIEVGAHTVTHPVLAALRAPAQDHEIKKSKGHLEETLGQPVTSFSYPYGGRADYSQETVNIVRDAGCICACSNFEGHVVAGIDCFQLPRFIVLNWDGEEFFLRLKAWFHG